MNTEATLEDTLHSQMLLHDRWPVSNAEVKSIAVAVLARFVLIPRSELPEVTQNHPEVQDSDTYFAGGENIVYTSEGNARYWVLRDVAVWQYIKDRENRLAEAQAQSARELNARKVEIALQIGAHRDSKAVERIIELEDQIRQYRKEE